MDEEITRERLKRAENDIRIEQQRIDEHIAAIQMLESGGHDTAQAKRALEIMKRSKHAMEMHRDVLLEELGLYETGESGTNPG